MSIFINFEEQPEDREEKPEKPTELINENLSKSVEELELSVRSYNCLKNANMQDNWRTGPKIRIRDAED